MKILISVHVVWWNASAYYAVTAAQALAARGHDVTVLAHHSTPTFAEARKRGLKVMGDINLLRVSPVSFFKIQSRLIKQLRSENFHIINPHRPEDHFHLALANRRAGGSSRLVRSVSDVRIPRGHLLNKILHQKWTDGIIYCAKCCRERYHAGLQLEHLPDKIIYSALDVGSFARGDWETGNRFRDLSSPRIGIVARLSPNKGHRTLIEAAAEVLREAPSASFIVAGKEEEVRFAELQKGARQSGVERAFSFTGFLADPRPVMAACDIGVVASTDSEVISRSTQEFFAFGVPVVAARINVLPEMVEDGVNGLLFPAGNAGELAAALLKLIKNPDLRRRYGEKALLRVKERHDLSVLGQETETFFLEIPARK